MFKHIQQAIAAEVSGPKTLELVAAIHGHDRWSTFAQYRRCGHYIATRMCEYGLDHVETLAAPADGVTRYGDWIMPLAWDVAEARLEIARPRHAARILADYAQEPACLAMWSSPTSPEGIEAEIVSLVEGAEGADLKGKVVFTDKHAGAARKDLVRRGAIGVVSDFPACQDDALAEAVCWVNAWTDYDGWGFTLGDTPAFGFSLDRERGAYLRNLLANGEQVVVRATVHSWLYEGAFLVPTGMIRGTSDEEVIAFAHAYEYGAEDNAAGCATLLEAARALNSLIEAGELPRPRRSIRFMMSWECYGSMAWCVERLQERRNVVAGLCVDDVAGKHRLTGGQLRLIANPYCQASCADYAAFAIAEACFSQHEGLSWRMDSWIGGTDHMIFQDPLFDVPMPWLTEHPAKFHHTSLDTLDKIDVQGLHRVALFAATYLYFLANAGESEADWLAEGTWHLWQQRMRDALADEEQRLAQSLSGEELGMRLACATERVAFLAERAHRAIMSVERFGGQPGALQGHLQEVDRFTDDLAKNLCQVAESKATSEGWRLGQYQEQGAREGERLVPRRLVPGPVTLCGIPSEERAEYARVTGGRNPMWSAELIFALYWADGQRPIADIRRRVELELGPVDVDWVAYFGFLERHGLVSLRDVGHGP